ncbi:MAG: putative transrane protein [Candidatus Solibacter sp.]|jgi:hypothetical protein|nr:putative transrane protein [Candidatus Solibacter sp.]
MEQVTRERSQQGRRMPGRLALVLAVLGHFFVQLGSQVPEYQVKAVFLLNFTKFIEWPAAAFAAPESPIEICVMGEDPFGKVLDQVLAGEVVQGRRVVAQRIKNLPAPKTCQVLFVAKPEKDVTKGLSALGPGVLTVGEGESFVRGGGAIAFEIENRRVRFRINETVAANAGLVVSSKLLNIARSIERE